MTLADSGARVATNYRNEDKARQWLSEVRAQGYDFKTYGVDVRDFEGCGQMVAAMEKDLGPIDIVVNNAGITMDVTFRKMAREQWDTVLGINLDSLFNVTRQVIGGMIDRDRPRCARSSSSWRRGFWGAVRCLRSAYSGAPRPARFGILMYV